MAGVEIYYEAFEEFRSAARRVKTGMDVSDVISTDPRKPVEPPKQVTDSTIFGKLPSSGELATGVDGVWTALGKDLGHARTKLEGVERAIDTVERNLRKADTPR